MIARLTGAAMRALLVAVLIATPALLLNGAAQASEIIALLALLAATMTFIEYSSSYPSLVEFRDAPPLNRIRFITLFLIVFSLTVVMKGRIEPGTLSDTAVWLSGMVGNGIDFPYSPVRLMVLMLPEGTRITMLETMRDAAGVAYILSILSIITFWISVRIFGWPIGNGPFNVWVNLPLFDPTAGGDVVSRLSRDARVNVMLGFLLPFLIPAIIKAISLVFDPIHFENPQTLVWLIAGWSFLPASMIMRGIALARISELIQQKRRQSYANAEAAAI